MNSYVFAMQVNKILLTFIFTVIHNWNKNKYISNGINEGLLTNWLKYKFIFDQFAIG